jgi:hypothetical protein
MSALDDLALACGSRRYARDLIESSGQVQTRPWWHVARNTWTAAEISQFIRARVDAGHPPRGIEFFDAEAAMKKFLAGRQSP